MKLKLLQPPTQILKKKFELILYAFNYPLLIHCVALLPPAVNL